MNNNEYEISAQEAKAIPFHFERDDDEEWNLCYIGDQDEAREWLAWACGPEGEALRRRLKAEEEA